MTGPRDLPGWGLLTRLSAVAAGLAALFTPGAQAAPSDAPRGDRAAQVSCCDLGLGEVAVRTDGNKVYFSDDGATFQELTLDDSIEARRLKMMLRDVNVGLDSVGVPTSRVIVAEGGASPHFQRKPARKSRRGN